MTRFSFHSAGGGDMTATVEPAVRTTGFIPLLTRDTFPTTP